MIQEEWTFVQGFENYEISSFGNVRSWVNNTSKRMTSSRLLKPSFDKNGYTSVTLYPNSYTRAKRMLIHRLVALHFIPNPDEFTQVNHKDEDKSNNIVTNLEWCTPKYNLKYSSIHSRGMKTKNKKKTSNAEKPVIGFKDGIIVYSFKSIAEAARESGCSRWGIRRCLLKQIKQIKGIEWKYNT